MSCKAYLPLPFSHTFLKKADQKFQKDHAKNKAASTHPQNLTGSFPAAWPSLGTSGAAAVEMLSFCLYFSKSSVEKSRGCVPYNVTKSYAPNQCKVPGVWTWPFRSKCAGRVKLSKTCWQGFRTSLYSTKSHSISMVNGSIALTTLRRSMRSSCSDPMGRRALMQVSDLANASSRQPATPQSLLSTHLIGLALLQLPRSCAGASRLYSELAKPDIVHAANLQIMRFDWSFGRRPETAIRKSHYIEIRSNSASAKLQTRTG